MFTYRILVHTVMLILLLVILVVIFTFSETLLPFHCNRRSLILLLAYYVARNLQVIEFFPSPLSLHDSFPIKLNSGTPWLFTLPLFLHPDAPKITLTLMCPKASLFPNMIWLIYELLSWYDSTSLLMKLSSTHMSASEIWNSSLTLSSLCQMWNSRVVKKGTCHEILLTLNSGFMILRRFIKVPKPQVSPWIRGIIILPILQGC